MRQRRTIILLIALVFLIGALVWWYRPDPHLLRTIAMADRVSALAFIPIRVLVYNLHYRHSTC
jgi:hypothetical protein